MEPLADSGMASVASPLMVIMFLVATATASVVFGEPISFASVFPGRLAPIARPHHGPVGGARSLRNRHGRGQGSPPILVPCPYHDNVGFSDVVSAIRERLGQLASRHNALLWEPLPRRHGIVALIDNPRVRWNRVQLQHDALAFTPQVMLCVEAFVRLVFRSDFEDADGGLGVQPGLEGVFDELAWAKRELAKNAVPERYSRRSR
jgi:hypothetical protein